MTRSIFVNLPVADLNASMAFYQALGFDNIPAFSDETAACMEWSETINVHLLPGRARVGSILDGSFVDTRERMTRSPGLKAVQPTERTD